MVVLKNDFVQQLGVQRLPRPNITMTVNGAYTPVNHKITLVNGLKIEYPIVYAHFYNTMKYGRNTVATKRAKYDKKRLFTTGLISPAYWLNI
jgi:hypothetical protein